MIKSHESKERSPDYKEKRETLCQGCQCCFTGEGMMQHAVMLAGHGLVASKKAIGSKGRVNPCF